MQQDAIAGVTTEYTPGPWSFDGPPHNIHVRVERNPHLRVCFLTSDGPTEANARLIAAAPDLVEALADLAATVLDYERVNNLSPSPGRKYCWRATERALEALAKAGVSPTAYQ